MTTRERLYITWIGSWDRFDHAVTDEETISRLTENRGAYHAVCGREFLPTAMECGPLPPCPPCVSAVRATLGMSDQDTPAAPRRRGVLSRLRCRERRVVGRG